MPPVEISFRSGGVHLGIDFAVIGYDGSFLVGNPRKKQIPHFVRDDIYFLVLFRGRVGTQATVYCGVWAPAKTLKETQDPRPVVPLHTTARRKCTRLFVKYKLR